MMSVKGAVTFDTTVILLKHNIKGTVYAARQEVSYEACGWHGHGSKLILHLQALKSHMCVSLCP